MRLDPPLEIQSNSLGKRHGKQWILRDVNLTVPAGSSCVIHGANGSGKSSLLRLLCGFDAPSEGTVQWRSKHRTLDRHHLPEHIAYCAPDQSLILDLTVVEHIEVHRRFRHCIPGLADQDLLRLSLLETSGQSRVRDLSSGMRQRLALSLAFTTNSSALFLDEPVSHLDKDGRAWYGDLLNQWRRGRTLVIASNHNLDEHPNDATVFDLNF